MDSSLPTGTDSLSRLCRHEAKIYDYECLQLLQYVLLVFKGLYIVFHGNQTFIVSLILTTADKAHSFLHSSRQLYISSFSSHSEISAFMLAFFYLLTIGGDSILQECRRSMDDI